MLASLGQFGPWRMKAKLLVVDDEPLILELLQSALEQDGYQVYCAASGQEALNLFDRETVDLAILDYSLPDLCGADLFHQLRAANPKLPVIFLTGHPNLEVAVGLMKSGVRDYLTKPFCPAKLSTHIRDILQSVTPVGRGPEPQAEANLGTRFAGGYILGQSAAMRAVETQVQNLPRYPDATVLLTGPTGTGKSIVARYIHNLTWRDSAPFVEIDCSTIPRELCESELFGHEKGAFTGAYRTQPGLFEAAGRGTAFLDEIGELDIALQAKFLRVLEARQFKRLGGHQTLAMSARVVAATNRSLPELVRTGRFREDLYFRLNVFEIFMPPLNQRTEDIPILAMHFLHCLAAHYKKHITGFTPQALDFLRNCDFPGNARELRNMIERAVINANTRLIHFPELVALNQPSPAFPRAIEAGSPLPPSVDAPPVPSPNAPPEATLNLAALERRKLLEALAAANGNKSQAAKLVGLSRTAFHRRLRKHQPGT